jgi:flagellum-specific ATP synthase
MMQAHPAVEAIRAASLLAHRGEVASVGQNSIESRGPLCSIGDHCLIATPAGSEVAAEVVAIGERSIRLLPLGPAAGVRPGAMVSLAPERSTVRVGDGFAGRAVDAFGQPIDGGGPVAPTARRSARDLPKKLDRLVLPERVSTGLRAIDGLVPLAKGQRIGIFAASGVGKTTLIEQLSQSIECDHQVICLIGERGREIDKLWQMQGTGARRDKATLIAATSDESAIARIRAIEQALALCEDWRAQGRHVVLFVDSLTRLAMALREVGLAAGEPPTLRSYTPNVFTALPRYVERCGADRSAGAITAIFSVLAETDDVDDPIVELLKSLLDGHIVLSRRLADRGHFPAIEIGASVSRVSGQVLGKDALKAALALRKAFAEFEDARTMIESGIYRAGSNAEIDRAIRLQPKLAEFLVQPAAETASAGEIDGRMIRLAEEAR